MISIPTGAKMVKLYEAEMQKVGKGVLYLLSNGISFEKKGEGAKFECDFDSLASYEAVKKNKLSVVIRTPQGNRSVEFKIDMAKLVEYDISQVNQEYANSGGLPGSNNVKQEFDQDAHSRSEARWFQENWDDIMKFLKPERAEYLNEYVKNVKIGSPDADPYLLVVDYENLTYKDFRDLEGFLKWRHQNIMDKEAEMVAGVFREFDVFSVDKLEMDVQLCKPLEHKFKKDGYTLYQFVSIVAREKLENDKAKNR